MGVDDVSGKLKERTRVLIGAIDTEEWEQSLEAQVETIVAVSELRGGGCPGWVIDEELVPVLAKRLNWTPARVAKLLELPRLAEIRRSLMHQAQHLQVLPGEEVYPTTGWIGEYLHWSQGMQVPLAFHFWSAITTLASASRRNFYFERGNHELFLNTYTILLAKSAMKKSQAVNAVSKISERTNELLEERYPNFPEDLSMVLLPDQPTPQRLVQMLSAKNELRWGNAGRRTTEGIGLFLADELVTLIGKNVYGSAELVHCLTSWYQYGKEYWTHETIARQGEKIYHPTLTFLGASTLDWLRTSVTVDMFRGGFLGRTLFCYRDYDDLRGRVFPTATSLDPITMNALCEWLVPLVLPPKGKRLRAIHLTPQAAEEHDRWYNSWWNEFTTTNHDAKMEPFEARYQSHLLKLAGLLSLSEDPERLVVDKGLFEHALAILDYEKSRMPQAFEEVEESDESMKVRKLMDIIKRAGGSMSRSDLMRKTQHFVGSAQNLDRILYTLKAGGKLEPYANDRRTLYRILV